MIKKFDEEDYVNNIKDIDRDDVITELCRIDSLIAFYNFQHSKWQGKAARTKIELVFLEATVNKRLRDEATGKTTEAGLKSAVALDPEVKALSIELSLEEEQESMYLGAVRRFNVRADNARSINTSMRAEKDSITNMTPAHSYNNNNDEAKDTLRSLGLGR